MAQAAQVIELLTAVNGTGIHGDIAVVVADELLEAAEPLETIYGMRGLSAVMVTAGEIYDEFGQGVADPGAIRSAVRWGMDDWSGGLSGVILTGDGHYDFWAMRPPSLL